MEVIFLFSDTIIVHSFFFVVSVNTRIWDKGDKGGGEEEKNARGGAGSLGIPGVGKKINYLSVSLSWEEGVGCIHLLDALLLTSITEPCGGKQP